MEQIENLVENEIPAKRSMVGSLALTQDKIMFFGGVSEQSGLARENCFIYDMQQGTIFKTQEIKLKERDAFPGDGYHYIEENDFFIVAGRYYVHKLDKKTLEWDIIKQKGSCSREFRKTHNDSQEDINIKQRRAK